MVERKLKIAVDKLELTRDMRERLLHHCTTETEETRMKKAFLKRPMVLAATLALCVCIVGATVLASTGVLQGYFKDLKRWDGAIIGQVYEQATDEIIMTATADEEGVHVGITLLESDQAPYRELDYLGLAEYTLIDAKGKEYNEPLLIENPKIANGQVEILIPQQLSPGDYYLTVTELVGSKKADQDLMIRGLWECDFSVND